MAGRLIVLLMIGVTGMATAQQRQDPMRFLRWTGSDARAFFPSLTRLQPLYLTLGGAAVYLTSRYDRRATRDTRYLADKEFLRVLEEFGNEKAIRPMSLMIFIGSLMQSNQTVQNAAFTSMESVLFANVFVNALKTVVGRARPETTDDPGDFSFFSGRTAFPSGHSATVFAFVTPWVVFFPHPLSYGLLALGAATAFTRVATGAHWLSDVVGGSAMGFGIGYWASRRHIGRNPGGGVVPTVAFNRIALSYTF
jgi:PAP2 superfamily